MKNSAIVSCVALLSIWMVCSPRAAAAPEPEEVITEPVSVAQYDDAIVIYLHGFDVARTRFPALELKYRLILADGTVGVSTTLDLTEPWEKPSIILRKDGTEYAGIVISASSGANVFFRRLYTLGGTVNAPTLVPTLAQNAAIELGQFVTEAPAIPLPDRAQFGSVTVGAAGRSVDADDDLQVISEINYPQVSSSQLCALSRQTDFPSDESKRSFYIPLKSQLYDQATGNSAGVAHYLCEIPINPDWLIGTEDLAINLTPSDIKVHRTDLTDGGTNILGGGGGGLGQGTGTMSVDADGNIYFSNSVPTDVVRFNVSTATFEVPPVDLLPLSNLFLPTDDEILGNGGTGTNGRWQTYRMVASMNHSVPKRMLYARTISKLIFDGTLYEWSALFTLPKDHWDDPVAFTNEFNLLVGSWPSAAHSFYDTLPVTDGQNRRIQYFESYGDTVYAKPYPGSLGGPWRTDVAADNTVEAFGTPDTFPGVFDDYLSEPRDVKPYTAGSHIGWKDYGLLTMERNRLYQALTGTNDTSRVGLVELNYDVIAYMLENPTEFAVLLDNIGGPSLAPSYMSIHLPEQQGKLIGVGEYGYYLAEFDVNEVTPDEVDKDYLVLDSPDPNVDLPLAVGLGPYGYQWVDLDGDDWLYIGGYIGMTRLKYSDNGVPLQRHTMDKFDTRLSTVNLDAAGGGAIKRYRYLQHGLDDRMFVTGTHTAARGGTAYSGGLLSFHKADLDTVWKMSYMSRSHGTIRMRNRVLRDVDGVPVQEFCTTANFNPEYANTIPPELVPLNHDQKVFMWDYKSGGQMRDLMGFSMAFLDGSTGLEDIAYSKDRRYLIIRQDHQLLTFDPQANRFIDGKSIDYGPDLQISFFQRPSHNFTRAPDDRLFLYLKPSDTATTGTFLEIRVSPEGALSVDPYLELQASSSVILEDTFAVSHTYLPDYANDDGSYDLFLGQQRSTSGGGTTCRVIEDFVPPRRHVLARTLNILSSGVGGASVSGTKPGTTPYSAVCSDAESVTLTASSPAGYVFQEWQDEDGNAVGVGSALQIDMDVDRSVTAIYEVAPDFTNIDPASKTIDYSAQNYTVTVSSNTSWNVTSLPAWISADPTSGTGNGTITMTAQANGSPSSRNDTITIGGESHAVTQQGLPALGAVTGLAATDNSYSEKIRITWSPVNLAEGYRVMRAAVDDFQQATEIAQLPESSTAFEDTTAGAGSNFYYWILAWRSGDGLGPQGVSEPGQRAQDTGGDSAAGATALNFSADIAQQSGHLESGDSDWYTFTVSASRFVEAYTTGPLDTVGAIYRSSDLSSPVNSIAADDDRGGGDNFRFDGLLEEGAYYIRVSGGGGNQSGAYQLRIELVDLAEYRPDLWTGPSLSKMKGNDLYSSTGSSQSFTIRKRRSAVCFFRAQNDGEASEPLRVKGHSTNRKFRFKYFRLGQKKVNVTAAIGRGIYLTPLLAPGEHANFRIQVTPRFSVGKTRTQVMKIRVFSVGQPGKLDVGKPILRITG